MYVILIEISNIEVVVNFISGLLNNINNKENNSKPEKEHSDKMIYVETCTGWEKLLASDLKRAHGRCT